MLTYSGHGEEYEASQVAIIALFSGEIERILGSETQV